MKLVLEKNAKIHVQGLVVGVLNVTSSIIRLHVYVLMVMKEIHLQNVTLKNLVWSIIYEYLRHCEIFFFCFIDIISPVYSDPCNPSPCGPNAQCYNGVCTCLNEYQGDPYIGCRPECILNTDCPRNKACIKKKCVDPCPGTCGQNAICDVYNHIPMCRCPERMQGNAFILCSPQQNGI